MLLCPIARGDENFNQLTLGIPPETKAELRALYAGSNCYNVDYANDE